MVGHTLIHQHLCTAEQRSLSRIFCLSFRVLVGWCSGALASVAMTLSEGLSVVSLAHLREEWMRCGSVCAVCLQSVAGVASACVAACRPSHPSTHLRRGSPVCLALYQHAPHRSSNSSSSSSVDSEHHCSALSHVPVQLSAHSKQRS